MSRRSAAPGRGYLFVLPWDSHHIGGVNAVVNSLAREMRSGSRLRPLIAVNDWAATRPSRVGEQLRFRFSVIGRLDLVGVLRALPLSLLRLVRLARVLRTSDAAVVNFHFVGHDALGVALLRHLRLYRGQLVVSCHGTDVRPASGVWERLVRRVILSGADRLIAVSNTLADRAARDFEVERSHVAVVYSGVDHELFNPGAAAGGEAGRIPRPFVLNVGRYVAVKDQSTLLAAFALVAERYRELQLCCAGADGAEREALLDEARRLGLGARVHLLHSLTPAELAPLYARAVACVQPSLAEGLPLAVLEAGASGAPLAVSAIPAHRELVQDGVSGLLFPVRDPAGCAAAIARLVEQPDAAAKMAATLRARILATFTWSACLAGYMRAVGLGSGANEG